MLFVKYGINVWQGCEKLPLPSSQGRVSSQIPGDLSPQIHQEPEKIPMMPQAPRKTPDFLETPA